MDAAAIRPMIALPGDPGNGRAIERSERVRVDIAYAGSCTAGKKADMDMYARVLEQAAARGERVAPWVRFYIQCGDRKSTRLNSSHLVISYAVFCLKKKKKKHAST